MQSRAISTRIFVIFALFAALTRPVWAADTALKPSLAEDVVSQATEEPPSGEDPKETCPIYRFDLATDYTEGLGNDPEALANLRNLFDLTCFQQGIDTIFDHITSTYGWDVDYTLFDDALYSQLRKFFDFKIKYGPFGSFAAYFDSSCTPLDFDSVTAPVDAACQELFYFTGSPISLIWNPGYDVESKAQIVQFSLDPRMKDGASLWKASPEAPLLVYDPQHTGVITSATQLFGHWTFGGQPVASLASAADPMRPIPWQNGYQALAILDGNRDGKLSGAELQPLGLWFDEKMDGVAEPGEVKSVDEAGIVSIFVKPDSEVPNPATGNIHATLGYERRIGSSVQRGESVDWFTDMAPTAAELFTKTFLAHTLSAAASPRSDFSAAEAPRSESPTPAAAAMPGRQSLSGVWYWKFEHAGSEKHTGALVIREDKEGTLSGFSVLEIAHPKGGAAKRMSILQDIHGKRLGERSYSWRLREDKNSIASSVRLSEDGQALTGSSSTTLVLPSGAEKLVGYTWKASRLMPPKKR